jgi:hypothetical protein
LFLQAIQFVVTGRAFNRFIEISSPHTSQFPKVPASILERDCLINLLKHNLLLCFSKLIHSHNL